MSSNRSTLLDVGLLLSALHCLPVAWGRARRGHPRRVRPLAGLPPRSGRSAARQQIGTESQGRDVTTSRSHATPGESERTGIAVEDDPDFSSSFSLLDANGEAIDLTFMIGSTSLRAQGVSIESGSSGLVQADESAVTIVLQGGVGKRDEEPRRVPIELRAGEVTVVRL